MNLKHEGLLNTSRQGLGDDITLKVWHYVRVFHPPSLNWNGIPSPSSSFVQNSQIRVSLLVPRAPPYLNLNHNKKKNALLVIPSSNISPQHLFQTLESPLAWLNSHFRSCEYVTNSQQPGVGLVWWPQEGSSLSTTS